LTRLDAQQAPEARLRKQRQHKTAAAAAKSVQPRRMHPVSHFNPKTAAQALQRQAAEAARVLEHRKRSQAAAAAAIMQSVAHAVRMRNSHKGGNPTAHAAADTRQ